MRRVQLIPVLFALCIAVSTAAAPPSWGPFDVSSADKKFVAKVTVDKDADKPEDRTFKLTVHQASDQKAVWTCAYKHTGHADGTLSDDGSSFASVQSAYAADAAVVRIYHKGKVTRSVKGSHFKIAADKLVAGTDGTLWLKQGAAATAWVKGKSGFSLQVMTCDGKTHSLAVAKAAGKKGGKASAKPAKKAPAADPAESSEKALQTKVAMVFLSLMVGFFLGWAWGRSRAQKPAADSGSASA